jgi:hypothetical protein
MSAPVIDTQPVSSAFIVSDAVTLSVAAHSDPVGHTLSYQWKKNGTNVSAATSATLTINPIAITDAGSYTCVVTDGAFNTTSSAAVLECDSIVAAIVRNRKDLLETISTTTGASFTPIIVEEERLELNIDGRYPYGLLLKAPIEPQEEDDHRDKVDISFMICWFFDYNDDDISIDEITYKYRNAVADTVKMWMTDRAIKGTRSLGLMEGTRLVGSDQGVAIDNKGNRMYRVDVVFEVFGFIDSDNPYLKG